MSTQRTITVFSTKGKRRNKIVTDVTTWEQLKPLVTKEGYDLSSLLATENITRRDLANGQAILPDVDFTLFLRPVKTKSGANYEDMSFKELRACLTDEDKEELKTVLNGRNWTQAKTQELVEYLYSKVGKKTFGEKREPVKKEAKQKAPKKQVEEVETMEEVVEDVADIIVAVAESKKETVGTHKEMLTRVVQILQDAIMDIKFIIDDEESVIKEQDALIAQRQQEEVEAKAKAEADAIAKAQAEAEAQAKYEEQEAQRRAEEEEAERLEKEAQDMMSGF